MKNKIILLLLLSVSLVFTSCDDSYLADVPQKPPQINLKTKSLSGNAGDVVTIQAHVVDDYALKYVKLISPPLKMDTTIYISIKHSPAKAAQDVIKSEVDFTYNFTIPDIVTSNEAYEILFKTKDLTNKTTGATIELEIQ